MEKKNSLRLANAAMLGLPAKICRDQCGCFCCHRLVYLDLPLRRHVLC